MEPQKEKLRHYCGVVGISAASEMNIPDALFYPLFSLQHRGQESAGITYLKKGRMTTYKDLGMVAPVLSRFLEKEIPSTAGIGHVRYSTRGGNRLQNVQPIQISCNKGEIALAHNGNLANAQEIQENLTFQGAIFQSTSDSELILHMIARSRQPHFEAALRETLDRLSGAYTLVMLHGDTLYAIQDPQGFRPLYVGWKGEGKERVVMTASETCALNIMKFTEYRSVQPGEILKIKNGRCESLSFTGRPKGLTDGPKGMTDGPKGAPPRGTDSQPIRQCIFELIYFAKPSSEVFDHSVHTARARMGEALSKDDPDDLGDVVVPVPDSGNGAALGYARAKGIPFEFGLSRNHYTGRSFILPQPKDRESAVRMKLHPVLDVVKNRRVILVDDSLVRGTTSAILVKLLREAGAAEIHLRLSAPEIQWPCFFGIAIPTREELISNRRNPEEIAADIGADSVRFLPVSRLMECVEEPDHFCYACFTGEYPILLPERLQQALSCQPKPSLEEA